MDCIPFLERRQKDNDKILDYHEVNIFFAIKGFKKFYSKYSKSTLCRHFPVLDNVKMVKKGLILNCSMHGTEANKGQPFLSIIPFFYKIICFFLMHIVLKIIVFILIFSPHNTIRLEQVQTSHHKVTGGLMFHLLVRFLSPFSTSQTNRDFASFLFG